MSHGVLLRLTDAKSATSQSYWKEPLKVAAYEQRLTTCIGPTSLEYQSCEVEPDSRNGCGKRAK